MLPMVPQLLEKAPVIVVFKLGFGYSRFWKALLPKMGQVLELGSFSGSRTQDSCIGILPCGIGLDVRDVVRMSRSFFSASLHNKMFPKKRAQMVPLRQGEVGGNMLVGTVEAAHLKDLGFLVVGHRVLLPDVPKPYPCVRLMHRKASYRSVISSSCKRAY